MRSLRSLSQTAAVSAVFAVAAVAQTDWRQLTPTVKPVARHAHAMASLGERIVLFGGRSDTGVLLDDTWIWDAGQWTRVQGPVTPRARRDHAMVEDVHSGQVFLTGGFDAAGAPLRESWSFDGVRWSRSIDLPSGRAGHAMAPTGQGLLLFGGSDVRGRSANDTWQFDGTNWTLQRPSMRPSARFGHRMTYDSDRDRVVLFGGADAAADTWEWDGRDWILAAATSGPGARSRHVMVWDVLRRRVVCFGGSQGTSFALRDTWEWDGTAWEQRRPASQPIAVLDAAGAFDGVSGRTFMFGGITASVSMDFAWDYGPDNPAEVIPFGSGCVGTAGALELSTSPGDAAWLGETFEIVVDNVAPGGASAIHAGASSTSWGQFQLPLALDFLGMAGCQLLARPDAVTAMPTQGGMGSMSVTVPSNPDLIGVTVYWQVVAVDPGANAAGLVTSNALSTRIGEL